MGIPIAVMLFGSDCLDHILDGQVMSRQGVLNVQLFDAHFFPVSFLPP